MRKNDQREERRGKIESVINVATIDSAVEALVRGTIGGIGERVCVVVSESNFKPDRTIQRRLLVFLDVKDAKIDLDERAG